MPETPNPPSAGFLLTAAMGRGYSVCTVLQNTTQSGMSPRKSVAIFSSIGFTPLGGMERQYNTRKGNTVRRLCAVLNILPAPSKGLKSRKGVMS
ncbi:MAG: hypothetical protein WC091_25800 [Sulfuricellaceae bacterium]